MFPWYLLFCSYYLNKYLGSLLIKLYREEHYFAVCRWTRWFVCSVLSTVVCVSLSQLVFLASSKDYGGKKSESLSFEFWNLRPKRLLFTFIHQNSFWKIMRRPSLSYYTKYIQVRLERANKTALRKSLDDWSFVSLP